MATNKNNITKRLDKGSALTFNEADQNFQELVNAIEDLQQLAGDLGTAASKDVTTSTTDTTTDRIVRVGDFGIGSNPIPLGPNDNLDDITVSGTYLNITAANTPGNNYPANVAGFLVVNTRLALSTHGYQQYISYNTSRQWIRFENNNVWSSWVEVYHTGNLLFGSSAGNMVEGNDARLSNARDWTAATVTQGQAETEGNTTTYKWTPQRVWQAIAKWWSTKMEAPAASGDAYARENKSWSKLGTMAKMTAGVGVNEFRNNSQNDGVYARGTSNKVSIGSNWTLELSGTTLLFKYSGTTVAQISSTGVLTAKGDITRDPSL